MKNTIYNSLLQIQQPYHKFSDSLVKYIGSRLFYMLMLLWFLLQAMYMALSTRFGIPPDEGYHFNFVKLFAQNGWLPILHSEKGYYFLGEVTHTPFFLYHYLLSLPYHLFSHSGHAYIYLRLINIVIALCSILIISRIAKQLHVSSLVTNLSIFMITNTLMFVFLSASINYENLSILLTLLSVSLLIDLWVSVNSVHLLLLFMSLVGGMMVSINFIPVAAAVGILFLCRYVQRLGSVTTTIVDEWRRHPRVSTVLLALLILLSLLFVQRYVLNIIVYHSINPSCTRLHTISQCQQDAIFRRTEILSAKAAHPHHTDLINYLGQWIVLMRDWLFGLLGSLHVYPTLLIRNWAEILLGIATLAIVRFYNPKKWVFNILAIVSGVYILSLLKTNYDSYMHTGLIFLAVQGRYLLPILPFLYIFANTFILKLLGRRTLQTAYIVVTLCVFVTAGLPSYILLTNADWHTSQTTKLNQHLHDKLVTLYRL